MVVGENVNADHILVLASKTLIGKFVRTFIAKETLNVWLQKVLGAVLGYGLVYYIIAQR